MGSEGAWSYDYGHARHEYAPPSGVDLPPFPRDLHALLYFIVTAEKESRRALELEGNRSKGQPLTFSARRDRVGVEAISVVGRF